MVQVWCKGNAVSIFNLQYSATREFALHTVHINFHRGVGIGLAFLKLPFNFQDDGFLH